MSEDNELGGGDFSAESFDSSYLLLIRGANKILDTLASVWKYTLAALLVSLSAIGVASIVLFFDTPGREVFFSEGVIFLAIAGWIFARNFALNCNQCCTEDIPRWKGVLSSFVKADNTVNRPADGQSLMENLMQIMVATGDWIRLIKRDVFSVLFWPVIATIVFVLTVYQVNFETLRFVAVGFVVYIFVLSAAVYYGVNLKFRRWQSKVSQFRGYTASAMENL